MSVDINSTKPLITQVNPRLACGHSIVYHAPAEDDQPVYLAYDLVQMNEVSEAHGW